MLPVLSFSVQNLNYFGLSFLKLGVFRVRIISWAYTHAVFVRWHLSANHGVFFVDAVIIGQFVWLQRTWLHMIYQAGSCNHILKALFLYLLHISLVSKHFTNVFYLTYVWLSCLFELLIIFYQIFIILVFFWVVLRGLFVVELTHVHLLWFFNYTVSLNYFF